VEEGEVEEEKVDGEMEACLESYLLKRCKAQTVRAVAVLLFLVLFFQCAVNAHQRFDYGSPTP
jgi:hypothetical protein